MADQIGRIGFRILINPPRPDEGLVDQFRDFTSPNIANAMGDSISWTRRFNPGPA
jgi:hypothetical protein